MRLTLVLTISFGRDQIKRFPHPLQDRLFALKLYIRETFLQIFFLAYMNKIRHFSKDCLENSLYFCLRKKKPFHGAPMPLGHTVAPLYQREKNKLRLISDSWHLGGEKKTRKRQVSHLLIFTSSLILKSLGLR